MEHRKTKRKYIINEALLTSVSIGSTVLVWSFERE